MEKSGSKLSKLHALAFKQFATKTILILNDSNTLLLSNNGSYLETILILILDDSNTLLLSNNKSYLEFCFIYVVWWLKAFCALRKKAKIG